MINILQQGTMRILHSPWAKSVRNSESIYFWPLRAPEVCIHISKLL